jgi:hypothetical protein
MGGIRREERQAKPGHKRGGHIPGVADPGVSRIQIRGSFPGVPGSGSESLTI